MHRPKAPDRNVIVRIEGDYRRAQFTGNKGPHGESYECQLFVAPEPTAFYHCEDILEYNLENVKKYLNGGD